VRFFRIFFLTLFIISVNSLFAQDVVVNGHLLFEDGAGVKRALVTYTNIETSESFTDTTDFHGFYEINNIILDVEEENGSLTVSPKYNCLVTNSVGQSRNFYFTDSKGIDKAKIFNILGQKVAEINLISEHYTGEGIWISRGFWDGRLSSGNPICNGIYFATVRTSDGLQTVKFFHNSSGAGVSPISITQAEMRNLLIEDPSGRSNSVKLNNSRSISDYSSFRVEYLALDDGDQFDRVEVTRDVFSDTPNYFTDQVIASLIDGQRLLFLGNSYTYFNGGIPNHLDMMFEASNLGYTVDIQSVTGGGLSLENHWNTPSTQSMISDNDWDYVFLQDQSQMPVLDPENSIQYGMFLDWIIDEIGAQTGFFMTWAREYDQGMINGLDSVYTLMGERYDAVVAPVGLAFQKSLIQDPDLTLHITDGSHPNVHGTYLALCVFYSTIWHHTPVGLEYRNDTTTITTEEREFLQNIAWETVLEYNERERSPETN
jgi:Domain of unknown function (DUF4886)